MEIENEYKLLVGAYYGICEMDEYALKEYILTEIDDSINSFLSNNYIPNYDEIRINYRENASLKVKLQDSLIILNRMNGPMELILMIKEKLKNISEK